MLARGNQEISRRKISCGGNERIIRISIQYENKLWGKEKNLVYKEKKEGEGKLLENCILLKQRKLQIEQI